MSGEEQSGGQSAKPTIDLRIFDDRIEIEFPIRGSEARATKSVTIEEIMSGDADAHAVTSWAQLRVSMAIADKLDLLVKLSAAQTEALQTLVSMATRAPQQQTEELMRTAMETASKFGPDMVKGMVDAMKADNGGG